MKKKTHVAYKLDYAIQCVWYEKTIASKRECIAKIAVAALLLNTRTLWLFPRRCLQLFCRLLLRLRFDFGTAIRHLGSDRLTQYRLPLVLHRCNTPSLLMFITSLGHTEKMLLDFFFIFYNLVIIFFLPRVSNKIDSQSLRIPIARHFCSLQYWQRFLWCFVTSQLLLPRHW